MKITILCENSVSKNGAKTCSAEWGLSLLIEQNKKTILFDIGHTDIYKENADNLNLNLEKIDFLVLSHSHWDHVGGIKFYKAKDKKPLITHPKTIQKLSPEIKKATKEKFNIQTTKEPIGFTKDIFFLGEIPQLHNFERVGETHEDSALAIKTKEGTVVITGCSHSGICNICEQAKKVTGQKLYAIIGGFHLFSDEPKKIEETIKYFKKENPKKLIPMHCMDFPTQVKFYQEFNSPKYGAGDIINI
jgi:7,8-dihydropterin-6-yl-methyl-4-(beta-D-ribofuranosyl)aminobenzene 5'-phosphate synthase